MKTLVTGGTGLIGSHIKGDYKYSSKELPLSNEPVAKSIVEKLNVDRIIHCAAIQKNGSTIENNHFNHFYENMMINFNMLKIASDLNIKEILSVSTINALPDIENCDELQLYSGPPRKELYSDGFVNRMLVAASQTLSEESNVRTLYPLLTNIYGPSKKAMNGIIPFFIKKCIECKKENKDLEILGDGSPIRDFIFVEDLDDIFNWMFDNYFENEPLIVSTGVGVSVKEIVKMIVKHVGFKGNVKWIKDERFNKKDVKVFNNKKLKELNPDIKFTSIESGLIKTIEWWLDNEC